MKAECSIRSGLQNIYSLKSVQWLCLICQENVAVFKEYNISRHFATKHANYASKQSTKERGYGSEVDGLLTEAAAFFSPTNCDSSVNYQASFMLGFKQRLASLSPKEFLKECMVETVGLLCPEHKDKFKKNQFITQDSDSSRRTD